MVEWRKPIVSRILSVALLAFVVASCGDGSLVAPTSPSSLSGQAPIPAAALVVRGFVRHTFRPCTGCLVEILDGPAAGTTATTSAGAFIFTIRDGGTSVGLRISKDGYRPVTTVASVREGTSEAFVAVTLESVLPPLPLASNYSMTIEADTIACSQAPPEVQTRTYDVTLARAYSDTTFWARPADRDVDKFIVFIAVSGNELAMHAEDGTDESAGIVESLPSGVVRVHVWSAAATPVTDPRFIQIPVAGEITYCPIGQPCTDCSSFAHRLTLTAR